MGYGSETAALGCGACEIRSKAAGESVFRRMDNVPDGARPQDPLGDHRSVPRFSGAEEKGR